MFAENSDYDKMSFRFRGGIPNGRIADTLSVRVLRGFIWRLLENNVMASEVVKLNTFLLISLLLLL